MFSTKKVNFGRNNFLIFVVFLLFFVQNIGFAREGPRSLKKDVFVNGALVDYAADPYLVLVRTVKNSGAVGVCTGSLISGRQIITAAHCLYDPKDLEEALPPAVSIVFSPKDESLARPSPIKIKKIAIPARYRAALKEPSGTPEFNRFVLFDFAILTLNAPINPIKNPYQAINNYCINYFSSAECNGQVFLRTHASGAINTKIFGLEYINSLFNIKYGIDKIGDMQKCAHYINDIFLNQGASVLEFLTDRTVNRLSQMRDALLRGNNHNIYCALIKENDNIIPNTGSSGSPLYFLTHDKNKMLAGIDAMGINIEYKARPPISVLFKRLNIYTDISNDAQFIIDNTPASLGLFQNSNANKISNIDLHSDNSIKGSLNLSMPILNLLFGITSEQANRLSAAINISGKQYLFFNGVDPEYMILDITKINPISHMPTPVSSTSIPKKITEENWPGLNQYAKEIRAAFDYGDNIYFLLNEHGITNKYIKYKLSSKRLLTPFPMLIDAPDSEIWNSIPFPRNFGEVKNVVNFHNGWIYYFFETGNVIKINPYLKLAVDATSEFTKNMFKNMGLMLWFDDQYWKNLSNNVIN